MPRQGLAIDISTLAGSGGVVTTIDDFVFESFSAGEMTPINTASRTNMLPYSHDFSQNDWAKDQSKVETSGITDPAGGTGSYKLTTENNTNQSYIQRTLTTEVGKYYTVSVYAQKAEQDYIALVGLNPLTIHYFNLANGTTSSAFGIGPVIEDVGNGWFRCSVTLVADTTSKFFGIYLAGDGGEISQGGVADDLGVYIYGAQFEQHSPVSALITSSGSATTVSTTLNDTSNVWDFDGTDIMIAEDPEDEGFWEEGGNIITGFANGSTYAFTTLTRSGTEITSAIVSSAFAGAVSNVLTLSVGDVVTVVFNYTKNSGDDLRVVFSSSDNGAGTQISNVVNISSSGLQSHDFTITATGDAYLQIGTGNSGHSINFAATGISANIYEITPLDI